MRSGLLALMLVGLLAMIVPVSNAAPEPPQCMQYYSEREVGPVKIVSRDSCHTTVYLCGKGVTDEIDTSCL